MNAKFVLVITVLSVLLLAGCVPIPAPSAASPSSTPARWATPTFGPTATPAFWPTGMPRPTVGPASIKPVQPTNKAEYLQRGGTWQGTHTGVIVEWHCSLYTTDGGKPCSDGSECEGYCAPDLDEALVAQVYHCSDEELDADCGLDLHDLTVRRLLEWRLNGQPTWRGSTGIMMTGSCSYLTPGWPGPRLSVESGALRVFFYEFE
jgi:hypothetical protein